MFTRYATFAPQTAVIDFRFGAANRMPTKVRFVFDNENPVEVDVQTVQELRRLVALKHTRVEGSAKISLIKLLRGIYNLGLKNTKDIADYFEAHYDIEAGCVPQYV